MNRVLLVLGALCCISGYLYSQQARAAAVLASTRSTRAHDPVAKSHEAAKRQAVSGDNQHRDPRWRMISAMLVLEDYSMVMKNRYADTERPALLHISNTAPASLLLKNILHRVCNIVAFHQLALSINDTTDSRDLYPLLSEIITDACDWLQYLVRNTSSVTLGEVPLSFNSCSPDSMTLLHHYCYRSNMAHLVGLIDVESFALHSYLSEYYSSENPPVPGANFTRWLETSSLPLSIRNTIHENTIMAILQYIIDKKL